MRLIEVLMLWRYSLIIKGLVVFLSQVDRLVCNLVEL